MKIDCNSQEQGGKAANHTEEEGNYSFIGYKMISGFINTSS